MVIYPQPEPGYIYLYEEDEIVHFCWRRRSSHVDDPEIDLFMVPGDGSFVPYRPSNAPTNGRIYVLKFDSSSQRYLFYLQSQSQSESKDPKYWSPRDFKLGELVNSVLQGQDVDLADELGKLERRGSGGGGDGDTTMEEVEGHEHDANHDRSGTGGAGIDATGGDIREEGSHPREGGADGGRAIDLSSSYASLQRHTDPFSGSASNLVPEDANAVLQNLLRTVGGGNQASQAGPTSQPVQENDPFTTLTDLLPPTSTIPYIEAADDRTVDDLLSYLPPSLLSLGQGATATSLSQKKGILRKVLCSPQFSQSLASLTIALHDGGLPSISEALQIKVDNGGYVRRGGVPLGNGEAVRVFIEGVKKRVEDELREEGGNNGDRMETD
ncbi:hypothetical protein KEM55_001394 [Ascosphaera atra]|nr:hypothetical protein KEM55_001394 [Ascosphaera atra]